MEYQPEKVVAETSKSAVSPILHFVRRYPHPTAFVLLAFLVALMLGDVFVASGAVLSSPKADIATLFLYWRQFGFYELRHGNLALWNPYILCGYPFFANFQSSLLYPLNWHYMFLPLDKAINLDLAIHVLLGGWFTYRWAYWRGYSFSASLLAGALLMFCDPFFSHIIAGHLTPLAVMAWSPLVFWACDAMLKAQSFKWLLIGMFAVAMQLFAGYPQYAFYVAVAAGVYSFCLLRKHPTPRKRWLCLASVAGFYVGGSLLAMIQVYPGLTAASESVRGGGVSFKTAASFSFPPENFLTLISPHVMGNNIGLPYWGYGYLWEGSLFFGLGGLVLAGLGVLRGEKRFRLAAAVTCAVCIVLALGAHTPVFPLLYDYAPGFNSFRGSAKFVFPAVIMLVMLAAAGLDVAASDKRSTKQSAFVFFGLAIVSGIAGVVIMSSAGQGPGGWWGRFIAYAFASREIYSGAVQAFYQRPEFVLLAGNFSMMMLGIAAGTCLLYALLLMGQQRYRWLRLIIVLVAVGEVFIWARVARRTFDLSMFRDPVKGSFYASYSGDGRTLSTEFTNQAMVARVPDLGGYDPCALRRYCEFFYWTQGRSLDSVTAYLLPDKQHPLFQMLRCKYVIITKGETRIAELGNAMPQVSLVNQYEVISGRDAIFERMGRKDFDPQKRIILEQEPSPKPSATATGQARVVESSSDTLVIEAEVSAPSILFVTDNYSLGWQAHGLPGSVQQDYSILPGNYTLRAIPIQAGKHLIRLEYLPRSFVIGRFVSIVGWLLFLGAAGWYWRGRKRQVSKR